MAELQRSASRGTAGDINDKVATQGEVINMVMQEARRRGMSWFQPHHAAGMVGSFVQETGNFRRDVIDFDIRGDDGTAHGLMQWRGQRYNNLVSYARGKNINPKNIRTQVAFALEEASPDSRYADHGSVRAIQQFKTAKTVQEAATAFVHAERPAGYDGNPNNAHDLSKRINHATSSIKNYEGGGYSDRQDPATRNDPDVRNAAIGQGPQSQDQAGFVDPSVPLSPERAFANAQGENGQDYASNDITQRPENQIGKDFGLTDFIFDQKNNPFLGAGSASEKNTELFGSLGAA